MQIDQRLDQRKRPFTRRVDQPFVSRAKTDHIAEYGLAALVGGIAAKKLGLLAVMTGFALKFAKLIAVAVIALGAGIKSLFGRKSS